MGCTTRYNRIQNYFGSRQEYCHDIVSRNDEKFEQTVTYLVKFEQTVTYIVKFEQTVTYLVKFLHKDASSTIVSMATTTPIAADTITEYRKMY